MNTLRSSASYEVVSAIFARVDCEFMNPSLPERYTVIAHRKDGLMHFGGSFFSFNDAMRVCLICMRQSYHDAAWELERIWNGDE